MNAPAHWDERPLRACDLCQFGSGEPGQRKCEHPEATRREGVPAQEVRSAGGACGPEARHMHLLSWGRV